METCMRGSGRGGWKRTEQYLAGRLLHYGRASFGLLRKRILSGI